MFIVQMTMEACANLWN